jgi:hypothetical protein
VDRIVAWYRVSSSTGAVVALVAANAVPLIGVLFLGWSVWNILIVYWLENGIVGAVNILKIARAEGDDLMSGVRINGRSPNGLAKAALIPFFVIHYGLFWLVHGIFVLTLPLFTSIAGGVDGMPGPFIDGAPGLFLGGGSEPFIDIGLRGGGIDLGWIAFAVVALAVSHGLSYWWNFLHGGEYRRVSPARQMFAPYGRLVVLHLTIIFGALALGLTGAPAASVAILVGIKTLLDVGFHLAEHRKVADPTV